MVLRCQPETTHPWTLHVSVLDVYSFQASTMNSFEDKQVTGFVLVWEVRGIHSEGIWEFCLKQTVAIIGDIIEYTCTFHFVQFYIQFQINPYLNIIYKITSCTWPLYMPVWNASSFLLLHYHSNNLVWNAEKLIKWLISKCLNSSVYR